MTNAAPDYVRCKDNSLVTQLLAVGRVYECKGAEGDNYLVKGKWLHRGRFEPATFADVVAQC